MRQGTARQVDGGLAGGRDADANGDGSGVNSSAEHQNMVNSFVSNKYTDVDKLTHPQTVAKVQNQFADDQSRAKDPATLVYKEIVKRLKSGKQKTSYMVVAMLYAYCDEAYSQLNEVVIDKYFEQYCSNYYDQFYEKPANGAPDSLLIQFMQEFTTKVAALCCIQQVSKINSDSRHTRYRSSVEYVAENDEKLDHQKLEIAQDTEYEKLVHKIADTLHQEAKQDLQACVLFDNEPNLSKTDLFSMLEHEYENDAKEDDTVIETQPVASGSNQLRPFANVRLRFI